MKLKYYGHACFSLSYEGGPTLVIDPFDETVTYPPCDEICDAALLSHDHFDHNHVQTLRGDFVTIRSAGAYDVQGVRITAVDSFHDKKGGALRGKNLILRIEGGGLTIVHLGDLGHMPDEKQLEAMSGADIMLVPIGGTYTIDTPEAEEVIRLARPKHAVAMHYRTPDYDFNTSTCEAFERDMRAVRMPREIEITPENLVSLPEFLLMRYK
ncbi:MAG: MBL fold metallo-hydrolase [Eubacteriales bacterium]|nr:MBL fold metallo-hydrolase [Eubacteriales bacterium]